MSQTLSEPTVIGPPKPAVAPITSAQLLPRLFVFATLLFAILFGCAGRLDLPALWAYWFMFQSIALYAGTKMDPGLRQERLRPGPGGTDRNFRWLVGPIILAHLIVACLDIGRYHWSDTVPTFLQLLGFGGVLAGWALPFWAMMVNRFFSPVVRIQTERGHHVITEGPYRYVRHPGYAGMFIGALAGPLALGSWWSFAPMALVVPLFMRRLFIEDAYLHEQLAGYSDYAKTTRYRLVPGVW